MTSEGVQNNSVNAVADIKNEHVGLVPRTLIAVIDYIDLSGLLGPLGSEV